MCVITDYHIMTNLSIYTQTYIICDTIRVYRSHCSAGVNRIGISRVCPTCAIHGDRTNDACALKVAGTKVEFFSSEGKKNRRSSPDNYGRDDNIFEIFSRTTTRRDCVTSYVRTDERTTRSAEPHRTPVHVPVRMFLYSGVTDAEI